MLYYGNSQKCITPCHPVYLAGYAARWGKRSQGIHDDLFVKAFYFEQSDCRMLLLFLDVEGIPKELASPVRKRIQNELGVEKVSFSATHCHSAPHAYPQVQLEHEEMDAAWVAYLQMQMFFAAQEAITTKFPALVGHSSIQVPEIARNRRKGHTETDPALFVLQITNLEQKIRGLILTYSCHCTVLDASNFLISSDYPGYIYKIMNKRFPDAVIAFSNGAAGDINIGYSSDASALGEKMDIRTFKNAERIAGILCDKAASCQQKIVMEDDVPIGFLVKDIAFPLREDVPTEESLWSDILALNKKILACSDEVELRSLKLQKIYLQCFVLRLHSNPHEDNTLFAQSMLVRIGKLLYVTIPGELFTIPGLAIKAHFNTAFHTAILGYSNGYIGYLPSLEAMKEGGYESETSIFTNDVADSLIRQLTAGPMPFMN